MLEEGLRSFKRSNLIFQNKLNVEKNINGEKGNDSACANLSK